MVALTASRPTIEAAGETYRLDMAGNVKIFQGALVALNATGFATKGAVSTTLKSFGRAEQEVDNTGGADGARQIDVKLGIFLWANSAAGDLITRADIGNDCFIVDDQTVAKTNGGATRSIAGKVVNVDASGVYVRSPLL